MGLFGKRSVCKECGKNVETNEYGFCKPCVKERRQRIIDAKNQSSITNKVSESQSPFNNTSTPKYSTRPIEKQPLDIHSATDEKPQTTSKSAPSSVDPIGLFQSRTTNEVRWREYTPGTEYAYWRELAPELQSRIKQEDGFTVIIDGVQYTYQTGVQSRYLIGSPNAGIVHRSTPTNEFANSKDSKVEHKGTIGKNDGTFAEIHIDYGKPQVAWTRKLTRERLTEEERLSIVERLFTLSKDKKKGITDFAHTKKEMIAVYKNTLLLQIDIQYGKQFTRTISGGNYDFVGGSKTGYLVSLSVESDDAYLLKTAVAIMRKFSFACYPSNFTAYCFLEHNMPTIAGQRELLTKICDRILTEVNGFSR